MFCAQHACSDSHIIGFTSWFTIVLGLLGATRSWIAKRCNYFMKDKRERERKKKSMYWLFFILSNPVVSCSLFIYQSPQSIMKSLREVWHYILNKSLRKYTDPLRTADVHKYFSHHALFSRLLNWMKNTIIRCFIHLESRVSNTNYIHGIKNLRQKSM